MGSQVGSGRCDLGKRSLADGFWGGLGVIWAKGGNATEAEKFGLDVDASDGTEGAVSVAVEVRSEQVFVDGVVAWDGEKGVGYNASFVDEYVVLQGIGSGNHTVTVM